MRQYKKASKAWLGLRKKTLNTEMPIKSACSNVLGHTWAKIFSFDFAIVRWWQKSQYRKKNQANTTWMSSTMKHRIKTGKQIRASDNSTTILWVSPRQIMHYPPKLSYRLISILSPCCTWFPHYIYNMIECCGLLGLLIRLVAGYESQLVHDALLLRISPSNHRNFAAEKGPR